MWLPWRTQQASSLHRAPPAAAPIPKTVSTPRQRVPGIGREPFNCGLPFRLQSLECPPSRVSGSIRSCTGSYSLLPTSVGCLRWRWLGACPDSRGGDVSHGIDGIVVEARRFCLASLPATSLAAALQTDSAAGQA
jgi:hypothetical protein